MVEVKDARNRTWLLPWSNDSKHRVLSKDCMSILHRAAKVFRDVDYACLAEFDHFAKLTDMRNRAAEHGYMFGQQEWELLKPLMSEIRSSRRQALSTDAEVLAYLQDLDRVSLWHSVRRGLSDLQNRVLLLNDLVKISQACRERAWIILDLGLRVLRLLDPIKNEIAQVAPDLLFAVDTRLGALESFSSLAEYCTNEERKAGASFEHPYYGRVHAFRKEIGFDADDLAQKWDPTLLALTFIVITSCIAPITIAWSLSPKEPGSTHDPNFWILLQSSFMQVLNFVAVMLPISRFQPRQAWAWAWTFAAVGMLLTIITPIAFVHLPTAWSSLFSFFGAVAQAAILLQLMGNVQPRISQKTKSE